MNSVFKKYYMANVYYFFGLNYDMYYVSCFRPVKYVYNHENIQPLQWHTGPRRINCHKNYRIESSATFKKELHMESKKSSKGPETVLSGFSGYSEWVLKGSSRVPKGS